MRAAAAAIVVALVTGCTAGPPRPTRAAIERALTGAPGAAQPSAIVAAEVAFARAAQEDGQWTAFRAYAAPGAVMHAPSGPFDAVAWLGKQTDPAAAVKWAPREIWMSCDGTLAVSRGRYRYPEGNVGTFVTLWQRQGDGDYRWLYDAGADDVPQPQNPPAGALTPNNIDVTAYDSIRGLVADCPKKGATRPELPGELVAVRAKPGTRTSSDGTLTFHWQNTPDGERQLITWWLSGGRWEQAMENVWPAPARVD